MRFAALAFIMGLGFATAACAQPMPAAPTLQPDSCGATPLQGFIGQPKTKLPVNLPKGTRVLCDTCAATMDYSPARLNVIFDAKTGTVTKIRCG